MLRSAFNYLRWGYTRKKAISVLDEMFATVEKYADSDGPPGANLSFVIQAYSQSISGLYPDLVVRYAAKVAAVLGDANSLEVRDNLRLMLQHARAANRFDPRGVRDALVSTWPFLAQWKDLDVEATGMMKVFERTDPNYWSGPMSDNARLNLNSGLTR